MGRFLVGIAAIFACVKLVGAIETSSSDNRTSHASNISGSLVVKADGQVDNVASVVRSRSERKKKPLSALISKAVPDSKEEAKEKSKKAADKTKKKSKEAATAGKKKAEELKKKAGECFPKSATVRNHLGREIGIADLQPRDTIMAFDWVSMQAMADTFLGDSHASYPEQMDGSQFKFLHIKHAHEELHGPFLITHDHLLYAFDLEDTSAQPQLMSAGHLRAGKHALLALQDQSGTALGPSPVISVYEVMAEGLYSPQTMSSTAIVNGVATSNYALVSPALQQLWEEHPASRTWAESIGWTITLPVRVLAHLGLPYAWLHQKGIHSVATSVLDAAANMIFRMKKQSPRMETSI